MSELIQPIASVRDSVCAMLRTRKLPNPPGQQPGQVSFTVAVVATAWCVIENRFLVTAFHAFNSGKVREANDKFFILAVPANGPNAYHVPIIGFPVERQDVDMAVVEIAPPKGFPSTIPAMSITFEKPVDGERVLTYGFPAPKVHKANVTPAGDFRGGDLFLKANANEGIVAGQYDVKGLTKYELNVGWHHGESGGPIVRLQSRAAFSIMQTYRNIQTPHGKIPGPHQGLALKAIESELRGLGVKVV
jgi:hypothetical protein